MQLLMGLLPRPKPGSDSSMPKSRFVWNIIHHNWGRVTLALAIANVYIGIELYVRLWSGPNAQGDLAAWIASVTVVLGLLLIVEIFLNLLAVYQQHRVKHSGGDQSSSAELAVGKDFIVEEKM